MESGEITEEQLAIAWYNQEKEQGRLWLLGQTLIELGYSTEDAITAIARQAGVSLYPWKIMKLTAPPPPSSIRNGAALPGLPIGFEQGAWWWP